MGADTTSLADAAAGKMGRLSRYRSVRRAQEEQPPLPGPFRQQASPPAAVPPMPALPDVQPQKDASLSRSMSRYHRRPTTSHATTANAPPPLPASTLPAPPQPHATLSSARNRAVSSPYRPVHAPSNGQSRPRTAKQRTDASPPVSSDIRQPPQSGEESARQLMEKEHERQRLVREKYEAEARVKREAKQAEMDRLEQLRRDEEEVARAKTHREAEAVAALRQQQEEEKAEKERGKRLRKAPSRKHLQHKEQEARKAVLEEAERKARSEESARRAHTQSPPVSPPRHEGGFGLFKRRKDGGMSTEETTAPVKSRQTSSSVREPETIRPGGGGAVLGIDAPVSAVNAGDRRVTVVCSNKRILLPVNPTTTPLDLIKSAATVLTVHVDVRTAVVTELFVKVSISRPLRNFEYVREVMNSWDSDSQNELTIVDSSLDGVDQDDLLAYKVPDTRPEGMSWTIQYSSKPGKWVKRFLTLRPDGQLVMTKNEHSKEVENICTLTDYDIYIVSQQKLAKIKPPKKICYAVKSMQKSNIFANESQYVHFFCTNDRSIATTFYKALQGWRSWHLKHEKGEGVTKKSVAQRAIAGGAELPHMTSSHNRGESVGSHYELGTYTTLIDFDSLNKTLETIEVHKPGEFPEDAPLAKFDSKVMHARKKSVRVKQPPPPAFKNGLVADARNQSGTSQGATNQNSSRQNSLTHSVTKHEDEETFAAGGLLGRAYTHRQRAAHDREQKQNTAFTDGPSLLNNSADRFNLAPPNDSPIARNSSVRSTHRHNPSSDLHRHASKRHPAMPEPLVDLTPAYRAPPQFSKENKGKGYTGTTGSGPLVEHATFTLPEEAIKIPSATRALPQHSKEGKGKGYTGPVGSGPLVDHATFTLPEEAIKVPASTDPWRARPQTAAQRPHAHNTHPHTAAAAAAGGDADDDKTAFTGGSLLDQTHFPPMHAGAPVGRGVMDGSKARGPMLDLGDHQQFAVGSLLSGLPSSAGPVVDRSGR
ncbi:hypothetical protein P153DRAFT_434564 [Dothidotthia symphoricarpi CBS 119687]|uniref:Uncharacterized protein n=1 Tax=Dothidotthia symphoricarpi CBS 119687 TaxID=1392245 RepID=A0A6A6A2Y6_9PLEO|nr:uncharacterized protein P153DRAFT_434564 [Dothidotthia symphoricarpi CBS 119687]KAF2125535.1 hypothetical protein P153DRAFT_434564 [Dothidotthia symphoricarpi CBS 119687]